MSCKEIAENVTYTTELIREIKAQTCRYFVALMISILCCLMMVGYIFYDRYLDSQFDGDAIETSIQERGTISYHGIGDINNGTEDKENKKKN